jgi:hypothetical protein
MSRTVNPEARVRRLQSALRETIDFAQEYLDSALDGATNCDGVIEEFSKPWCDEMAGKLSRWRKVLSDASALN